MKTSIRTLCLLAGATVLSPLALAEKSAFTKGPVIEEFGENVAVKSDLKIPLDTEFKVAFDIGEAGKNDKPSRSLNTAARFINMHARAGIPADQISVAIVVHGSAYKDLLKSDFYDTSKSTQNPSISLINALLEQNTKIYLCGQTAAYYGVTKEKLLPGIELSLSAMTAHALLQQDGYTLNPF